MRPYRVPKMFRPEVNRQIKVLLELGPIRLPVSPMASLIVRVAKKTGGVRIACDYRYLNSFTVGDAFPVATVNETLYIRSRDVHKCVRRQDRVWADIRIRRRLLADCIRDPQRPLRLAADAIRSQECRSYICSCCVQCVATDK